MDLLGARHVIRGAEMLGLRVFPSTDTCWSFDDKISQKYQLEAVGAPLAPTYCFFSEEAAAHWAESTVYPVVAKLRRGAGSANVKLLRTKSEALRHIRQSFRGGFAAVRSPLSAAVDGAIRRRTAGQWLDVAARAPKTIANILRARRAIEAERGYVYFQQFLPNNSYDVRVTVIGDRAFGFSRNTRPGDFRASGSGSIDYSFQRIDPRCLTIAFGVTRALRSQSVAYDFAFDAEGAPRILETSYAYQAQAVHDCPGYWNERRDFVPGHVWPQDAILDDLLSSLTRGSEGLP
jgi:glutathione synthase/RimK-type ligase-like ATP-grasp enzyme